MTDLYTPDRPMLENWLRDIHVQSYMCGDCEGIHISALQSLEGVVNSRISLQHYGVIFSTELEIRPMALLALAADNGRLNMEFPTLKIFLDIVDDATPQLVASAALLTSSGITLAQFTDFVVDTMEGARRLTEECLRLDYLFAESAQPGEAEDSVSTSPSRSVH